MRHLTTCALLAVIHLCLWDNRASAQTIPGVPDERNPDLLLTESMAFAKSGDLESARRSYVRAWDAAWFWAFYNPNDWFPNPTGRGPSVISGSRRVQGIAWLEMLKTAGAPAGLNWQPMFDDFERIKALRVPQVLSGGTPSEGFWIREGRAEIDIVIKQDGMLVGGTWLAPRVGGGTVPVSMDSPRNAFDGTTLTLDFTAKLGTKTHTWTGTLTYRELPDGRAILEGDMQRSETGPAGTTVTPVTRVVFTRTHRGRV